MHDPSHNLNRHPSFDQYQPQVVTQVGVVSPGNYARQPSQNSNIDKIQGVTYLGESVRPAHHHPPSKNMWLQIVGVILCLLLVAAAIYFLWIRKARNVLEPIEGTPIQVKDGVAVCHRGFFQNKGKCLMCPSKSQWNGSGCQAVSTGTTQARSQFNPHDLSGFIGKIYKPESRLHHGRSLHLRYSISH